MPEVKLDVIDAAELAEMLQFLSQWLGRDPARLGASWRTSSATPPTASPSCAATWSASSSCSEAATVSPCSGSRRHEPPGSPASRGYAGPCGRQRRSSSRWRAAGADVDPHPGPAWTGTYPGQAPAGVAHRLAEARDPPQGSVALKTSVGFVLVVGVVLLLAGAHSGLLDGYGASQLVLT